MKKQHLHLPDDDHRVLPFRPRHSTQLSATRSDPAPHARVRDEPDDFRHRMLANAAAGAFTIALTGIGIWLASSIADLRSTQDCVLMGRPNCGRIAPPPG